MHQHGRPRRLVAGLIALGTICMLLAGVPVLLHALAGSPLPDTLPSWSQTIDTLSSRGISDDLLIDIIAFIGWVAWFQVAASIVIEVAAWGRGRPAPRLRLAGPAQPAVRKLIATAALLLSHPNPAAALPARPVAAVTMPIEVAAPAPVLIAATRAIGAAEASEIRSANYTVVRYDTLWGIAEANLGDPLRWREIFDTNRGVPQPDGRTLTDPGLIRPGWTLQLPSDAVGVLQTTPSSGAPPQATAPAVVAPKPPSSAVSTSPPTLPTTSPTTLPASLPPLQPPSTAVSGAPASAPATTPALRSEETASNETDEAGRSIPWPLIGGGLATAGIVTLLDRLRRVQQRRRPTGTRPRPPRPELEEIERRLRHIVDLAAAERLDLALRALGAGLDPLAPSPTILAVRAGNQDVEILLAEDPPSPPKGFITADHERGWVTDPHLDTNDLWSIAAGAPAPLPSLVSVGALDGDHLLIDLETAGLLTIAGSGGEGLIRSLITQLATATWIDHIDLLLVSSTSTADIAGGERVRRAADLDAAIAELRGIAGSMADALDAAGASTTMDGRFSGRHGDGWIPTILVSTEALSDEQQRALAQIVDGGRRGVAVVAPSTTPAPWHLTVECATAHLAPLGLSIVPSTIEPEAAASIDELLTEAAMFSNAAAEELPAVPDDQMTSAAHAEPYVDPHFDIEVRVLGPIEVHGVGPIDRRKSEELVAYLALHPKGASDDRIKTVLWRDRAPTTPTFNTTVSFARTALGQGGDGEFHLPHYTAAERVYRVGPAVTTDLARVEARIEHARSCSPEVAIETLRSALELVRGVPFEGARGYEWAYSELIVAHIEAAISDAANGLAELYLAACDHAGATWAARQGLKVCPADERLYRALMKSRQLARDPAGAEAAFQELCDAIDALEPYDCLQEETLTLRRETPRSRA